MQALTTHKVVNYRVESTVEVNQEMADNDEDNLDVNIPAFFW